MSFAEQLAARAAESRPQANKRPASSAASSTPSPPRPGNIRGRRSLGSGGGALRSAGRSPGLFAEQLRRNTGSLNKLTEASDGDSGRAPGGVGRRGRLSSPISGGSTASDSALPFRSPQTRQSDVTAESDSTMLSFSSSSPSTPCWNKTPSPTLRKGSLLPSSNSMRHSDEEADEYDLVGFSFVDASHDSHAAADVSDSGVDESCVDDTGDGEAEGMEIKGTETSPMHQEMAPYSPEPERRLHPHEIASLQGGDLSPIIPDGGGDHLRSLSSSSSLRQRQPDPELQSKLQRQLLKCQTQSERMTHSQERAPVPQSATGQNGEVPASLVIESYAERTTSTDSAAQNNIDDAVSEPVDAAAFGAWARIESLQQRCREAEDRARREGERAELANYELSLIKDRRERSGTVEDDDVFVQGAAETSKSKDGAMMTAREAEAVVDVAAPATNNHGPSCPSDAVPHNRDAIDASLWMRRALEAEGCLAKHAESPEPPQTAPPPPSHHDESAHLIRLKNAEIDVLRSQVHRLERRAREECDRNDDLLRSLSYLSGSLHEPLGGQLERLDGDRPPLVVASECISAASGPSPCLGGADELRLMRSELYHLQYQLRTGKAMTNRGSNPTSAYSMTAESTLSSLDGDGNGDTDEHVREGVGETEEQEEECNSRPPSSFSSLWGLCCVRKRSRGYGKV